MSKIDGGLLVTGKITAGSYGGLNRSDLPQETKSYSIPFSAMRRWDDLSQLLPSAGATDDLGIVEGTFGTNFPTLQTEDLKAESGNPTLNYAAFLFSMPPEYVVAGSVSLVVTAGMVTTVADDAATIDAEIYSSDEDNTVSADLVTTAAQDINSLTPAAKTFAVTASGLDVGTDLICRLRTSVSDAATGTAVIAAIYKVALNLSVRG